MKGVQEKKSQPQRIMGEKGKIEGKKRLAREEKREKSKGGEQIAEKKKREKFPGVKKGCPRFWGGRRCVQTLPRKEKELEMKSRLRGTVSEVKL